METRFVDAASGRVVLATADRRTARQATTQTRDVAGTTALLNEATNYLVMDLVNFLGRLEKTKKFSDGTRSRPESLQRGGTSPALPT